MDLPTMQPMSNSCTYDSELPHPRLQSRQRETSNRRLSGHGPTLFRNRHKLRRMPKLSYDGTPRTEGGYHTLVNRMRYYRPWQPGAMRGTLPFSSFLAQMATSVVSRVPDFLVSVLVLDPALI